MRRVGPVLLAAFLASSARGEEPREPPPPGLDPLRIDALFAAIASRFGPVELDPALLAARPKFARDSLSPSRLVDDATLWTTRQGPRRSLEFGARAGLPYRVFVRTSGPPEATGTYRGTIGLDRRGAADFEWRVRDELGIGPARTADVAGLVRGVLRAIENSNEGELRTFGRSVLPRASRAWGRLYALDRLDIAPAPGGGAVVSLGLRMDVSRIRAGYPRYARFIEAYLSTARYAVTVADAAGTVCAEVTGEDLRMVARLRLFRGALAPLAGPPRALAEPFLVTSAFSIKAGMVRVGVERLVGEALLVRTPSEKRLRVRFAREPDFVLPFLARSFLRSSLRRPFEGEGALLEIVLADAGEGARLEREYRFAVKESWIVRWLGGFGGGMATVFRAGAEAEADRFDGEGLWALRDDLVAYATARSRPVAVSPRR